MNSRTTSIKDIILIEPKVFTDDRGYFVETFRSEYIEKELGDIRFVQENESFSKKGVLRGLHYQTTPFAQAKLVRCVVGTILDIAVDIRQNSPTFGQYVKVELSGENKRQVFIPHGFAHGFLTLSDWAVVSYKVDNYYNKEAEGSIRFDDKTLAIDWELNGMEVLLSDKDANAPCLNTAKLF